MICGTTMGFYFVIVYACLFLCFLENDEERNKIQFIKLYIDDALGFWDGKRKD